MEDNPIQKTSQDQNTINDIGNLSIEQQNSIKESNEADNDFFNAIDYDNDLPPIFFFVNSISGSHEGQNILSMAENLKTDDKVPYMIINCPTTNEEIIQCIIINIFDAKQMNEGINLIASTLASNPIDDIKILIGGGDGTVLILVEDLNGKDIDISRCIFGHVPLGTGNDLSNALGFGNTVQTAGDATCLYDIINTYNSAQRCKVDVWNVKVVVENEGKIIGVNNDIEKVMYDKDMHPLTRFSKTFINYLSLGYDARIGFSFAKRRSNNRIINKMIYFGKAAKKFFCCSRTYPIKNFISSFQVFDSQKIKYLPKKAETIPKANYTYGSRSKRIIKSVNKEKRIDEYDGIITDQEIPELHTTNHIIFNPVEEVEEDDDNISTGSRNRPKRFKQVFMHGDPVVLVCQNINFYLGGARDIWKHSGDNMGIKAIDYDNEYRNQLLKMATSEQRFDDKQLEFFTYESEILLGLENLFVGHADKIYHGTGPVKINFVKQHNKHNIPKVYMNIDGEFVRIDQPKALRIKLNKNLSGGQLNFLQYITIDSEINANLHEDEFF